MTRFTAIVKEIVKNIPPGQTLTYAAVARKSGSPKAVRAVANVLAKNYDQEIPCHRVIRSDGRLGGYNRGGERAKRDLLLAEGAVL